MSVNFSSENVLTKTKTKQKLLERNQRVAKEEEDRGLIRKGRIFSYLHHQVTQEAEDRGLIRKRRRLSDQQVAQEAEDWGLIRNGEYSDTNKF